MSDILNYQFQNPMQTFLQMSQMGAMISQQRAAGANAAASAAEAQAKLYAARVKAESDAAKAVSEAARQARVDELMERLNKPGVTAMDYIRLSAMLPKDQADAMREAAKLMSADEQRVALDETGQIFSAFQVGRPDLAAMLLRRQAEAERAANNEQGALMAEEWIKTIEEGDPEKIADLQHMFGTQLTFIPGGDKVVDAIINLGVERRAAAAEPDAIKKRLADLNFTEAQTNKMNVEARKLGLDADKLAQDIEIAKKALPPAKSISAPAEKLVNDSVMAAAKSKALAAQYTTLAGDFEKAISTAGATARASELVARLLGTEKEPTALRQEYLRMRNTAALEMLPPGVASDKDIEIAMAAFPTETSSPANIARFLRGMAKLQAYEAAVNGAQAEWIQQNGTLGTSAAPMTVGGKTVAQGTRFQDFVQQYIPNTSVLGTGGAASAPAQPVEEVDL